MSERKGCTGVPGIAAVVLCLGAGPVSPHHSVAAEFDTTALVTIDGHITELRWINPHVVILLESDAGAGEAGPWAVEITPPGALARIGFERDWLEPGAGLSMDVWVALDGSRHAHGRIIRWDDGRSFELPMDNWSSVRPDIEQPPR